MRSETLIILVIVLLFLWFASVGISVYKQDKLSGEVCKAIGYESYEYKKPWDFCVDKQGNFHYVEIELSPWIFPTKAEIKEINVGDVRVVGG